MRLFRAQLILHLAALVNVFAGTAAPAADLLSQVPQETLAFVVLHNLESVDGKTADIFRRLGVSLPRPLELIRQTTGMPAVLNSEGDVLIGVAVSPTDAVDSYLYALIPCSDPAQFIASLGGAADKPITAVTIAGVDVLAAPRDEAVWLVDASQRHALELMLGQPEGKTGWSNAWTQWASPNDATIVVTAPGVQELVRRSMQHRRTGEAEENYVVAQLSNLFGRVLRREPRLGELISQAKTAAVGIRVDDIRGPIVRLRLEPQPYSALVQVAQPVEPLALPRLQFTQDPYVVAGQTMVPRVFWRFYGAAYIDRVLAEVQRENATIFRAEDVAQFTQVLSQAAERVSAAMLLARSTEGTEAVFSNRFLFLHVGDADSFFDQVKQAFTRWNEMSERAEGLLRMRFDEEETEFGKRTGVEYSCDVAAAIGEKDVPGLDSSMEKLFGDEGRLLIQVVRYDEQTVLFANATRKQIAAWFEELDQNNSDNTAAPDETLGGSLGKGMASRMFFDPHQFSLMRNREYEAMLGGDVAIIGGPIVPPFPTTTPIKLAAGFEETDIWLDASIPWAALEGLADYLRAMR